MIVMKKMATGSPPLPAIPPQTLVRDWTSAYGWIPFAGGFTSFALAFMAGANDVPTSFGSSVGSGTLTLRQSVVLAFVMEIAGAMLLGNRNIDGTQSNILKDMPDVDLMMWGFMIAMIAATIWLAVATFAEMPVTSILSIKGAIIGIALTTQGFKGIHWSKHDSSSVLGVGGVTAILLSWVVAPSIAAALASILFGLIKFMLLRPHGAERRTLRALPLFYGVVVLVLIFIIIYRGVHGTSLHDVSSRKAAVIAGSSAALAALLAFLIVVPLTRKRLGCSHMGVNQKSDVQDGGTAASQDIEKEEYGSREQNEISPEDLIKQFNELRVLHTVYEGDEEDADNQSPDVMVKCSPICGPARLPLKQLLAGTPNRFSFQRLRHSEKLTTKQKVLKFVHKCKALTFDHKTEYGQNTLVRHALAEKFDEKVEEMFSLLLILAACATALVHGSNDVPSIMGPYGSILKIFKMHSAPPDEIWASKWDLDVWVCAVGGIGVSIGYAVWGWKLVRCLGGRLSFLTPSRAFSAQICTVATALMASRTGIPVSATHIFIGAILGVSIADSIKNINWQLIGAFAMMWGLTLVFTSGTATAIYAFTIFSPSVPVRE